MQKRSVKKELFFLFYMELFSALLFWVAYIVIYQMLKTDIRISVVYALFVLTFIVIQGSFYWLNCFRRCERKKALESKAIVPLYKFFKYFNNILLVAFILVWLLTKENLYPKIISALIWGFAIVEQINYYYFRLSYYTKSGLWNQIAKPLKNLFTGKAEKSQIAKEIERYKRNIQRCE